MIDLKLIRDNPDLVRAGILKKQGDPALVDRILEKDLERRTALQQVETLRAEQNRASKEVPRLQGEERERRTAELRDLSSRLKGLEADLAAIERALETLLLLVPNPPHESVPPGRDERDNVTLRTWGAPPKFDFPPLDHVDLGRRLGIFDLERGAKVSGSRFYFLRGAGVLLEQALTRFSLDLLRREGFTLVTTPMLIRTEVILGAMGGDRIDDQQVYRIVDEDLGLIGTSEHAMLGMFKDEVLEETQLPIRLAGLSWCFRREAGSWGKDVRGIYRVHQFEKVEMFSFCHPDRSWEEHEYLLSREERLMQTLGLPYRVVNICGGDLGAPAAKKYDIEAWMPGREGYGETHSCSNCTDFQARRVNARFRKGPRGPAAFVHTLNGTAMANTRMLIAILENGQQADGSVRVPDALVPYVDGLHLLSPAA